MTVNSNINTCSRRSESSVVVLASRYDVKSKLAAGGTAAEVMQYYPK
jgi:hypothetical protein